MKSTAAFILLIALLAQISNRYFVLLDYEMNKDFIAKTLCMERDKPMSCCKGKCYLKKQLDKSAKEENVPNTNTRADKNEVLLFTEPPKMPAYLSIEQTCTKYFPDKQLFLLLNIYGDTFHPPRIA